jgi:hypothetical protein
MSHPPHTFGIELSVDPSSEHPRLVALRTRKELLDVIVWSMENGHTDPKKPWAAFCACRLTQPDPQHVKKVREEFLELFKGYVIPASINHGPGGYVIVMGSSPEALLDSITAIMGSLPKRVETHVRIMPKSKP